MPTSQIRIRLTTSGMDDTPGSVGACAQAAASHASTASTASPATASKPASDGTLRGGRHRRRPA
jgi:hypothetical protein